MDQSWENKTNNDGDNMTNDGDNMTNDGDNMTETKSTFIYFDKGNPNYEV